VVVRVIEEDLVSLLVPETVRAEVWDALLLRVGLSDGCADFELERVGNALFVVEPVGRGDFAAELVGMTLLVPEALFVTDRLAVPDRVPVGEAAELRVLELLDIGVFVTVTDAAVLAPPVLACDGKFDGAGEVVCGAEGTIPLDAVGDRVAAVV
jgi:hypothetical protein